MNPTFGSWLFLHGKMSSLTELEAAVINLKMDQMTVGDVKGVITNSVGITIHW